MHNCRRAQLADQLQRAQDFCLFDLVLEQGMQADLWLLRLDDLPLGGQQVERRRGPARYQQGEQGYGSQE